MVNTEINTIAVQQKETQNVKITKRTYPVLGTKRVNQLRPRTIYYQQESTERVRSRTPNPMLSKSWHLRETMMLQLISKLVELASKYAGRTDRHDSYLGGL
jgi:hypothetical protein